MIFSDFSKYNKKTEELILIIGSGPAGISLALELEKKKINSLILEAGDLDYSEKSQDFYEADVIGDHLVDDIKHTRLRMFGGTSGHWGGTCRPLDGYDFKKWPIEKKDLDIYKDKTSKILNIKSEFKEKNINTNFKLIEFQTSSVQFGEKYKHHILKSRYIDLIYDASLIKFIGNEGIVFKAEIFNKKKYYIKAKKYILATGGIENSRILLWSRNSTKNFLDKNLPIGNNWYTHPYHELGEGYTNNKKINQLLKNDFNKFENGFGLGPNTITYNISPTNAFILKNKILNFCVFIVTTQRENKNFKNILKNLLCVAPNLTQNLVKKIASDKTLFCGTTFVSSWEQDSQFSNRIELGTKLDNLGVPKTKIYYKKSNLVRTTARVMMEELGKFYIEKNIGRLNMKEFLFNKDEYKTDGGGQHHLGGTIMGERNTNSVVDKNLKVHNTTNLYILGSSVYPTGGHANPTFTIIQLACKLSDHLKEIINV